jgi:hypothetical protein
MLLGSVHVKAAQKALMKLTPGVDFINIFLQLFRANKMRLLPNGVWQTVHIFGECRTNFEKFSCTVVRRNSAVSELVKLNGASATFHLGRKFCEIGP